MSKIKMLNRISIDGYFASPNEASFGMDWFIHDPEVDKAAH
ncbi:MAG: dihydrofolate reductase, partial [Paenibacillus sp.]|nr:dihydrofolate reductase [Paenibacillus sp.]